MNQADRRVVVTGGAGFIGSHMCQKLIESGARVVCVDNMSTGTQSNLAPIQAHPGLELLDADVTEGLHIDPPVDAIIHLASPASPPDYLARPLETLAAGAEGTRHALTLATEHRARFILASTSEVYGDPIQHPQSEQYWGNVNPVGPRSVYDEAKRFAEALTMAWHRTHQSNIGIARIFNTYGPRMRPNDGRVVSNFIVQALKGKPLTVYGDGAQTRSFCFVDDMVTGLLALLDSSVVGPVNLGNPDERSVLELAEIVLEVTGAASEIVFSELPIDDPVRRCPDIGLARRDLGWHPQVQLRDGLRTTATHFASRAT